jgi:hypothetical protein
MNFYDVAWALILSPFLAIGMVYGMEWIIEKTIK